MQSTGKVENMRKTTMLANQSERTKLLGMEAFFKLHFHMQIQMQVFSLLMDNIGKTCSVRKSSLLIVFPQWLSCNLAQA